MKCFTSGGTGLVCTGINRTQPLNNTMNRPCFHCHRTNYSRSIVASKSKQKNTQQSTTAQQQMGLTLTDPLHFSPQSIATASEAMPAPLWSTFNGVTNGMWCGKVGAYNPQTGKLEQLSPTTGKAEVSICCIEERQEEERTTRHSARAASLDQLMQEMARGGSKQFDPTASVDFEWDTEYLDNESSGLFIFDGGSYTKGPSRLLLEAGTDIDEDEDENRSNDNGEDQVDSEEDDDQEEQAPSSSATLSSHIIEFCLQWGGQERVRISATIATDKYQNELDIDLLRVTVSKEAWEGLPGTYVSKSPSSETQSQQTDSSKTRLDPFRMLGNWKVFQVSGSVIEDMNIKTGIVVPTHVYFLEESLCTVAFAADNNNDGSGGGTLWLPHNVAIQLEMVAVNGGGGFEISAYWMPSDDMIVRMTRLYDPNGHMMNVTNSTAIRN